MFPCLTMAIALHPEDLLLVFKILQPHRLQLGLGCPLCLPLQPQTCPSPTYLMFAYLFQFKQLFLFHIHMENQRLSMRSMAPAGAIPVPVSVPVPVPWLMLPGWAACRKRRCKMTNGDRGGDTMCVCQLTFVSLRTEEERN